MKKRRKLAPLNAIVEPMAGDKEDTGETQNVQSNPDFWNWSKTRRKREGPVLGLPVPRNEGAKKRGRPPVEKFVESDNSDFDDDEAWLREVHGELKGGKVARKSKSARGSKYGKGLGDFVASDQDSDPDFVP